jgi:chemotaxis protein MotA
MLTEIGRFIDPLSLLIVAGGALLIACTRAAREDIARAFAALGPLFRANPAADANAAIVAVGRIEKLSELRSIACADRIETTERFLRRAGRRLAASTSAELFARWCTTELDTRRRRHEGAIDFWRTMADAAPAMGMIGTVIGLIQMFAAMDDVSRIGPAMALAMLTTLYGIVISGVIAGPIAARLARLSEAELLWQTHALERLQALAVAELAPPRSQTKPVLRTVS